MHGQKVCQHYLTNDKEFTKVRRCFYTFTVRGCLGQPWSQRSPGYVPPIQRQALIIWEFETPCDMEAIEPCSFIDFQLQNSESLFKFSLRFIQVSNLRKEREEPLPICSHGRQSVCPETGGKIRMKNVQFWYSWRGNGALNSKRKINAPGPKSSSSGKKNQSHIASSSQAQTLSLSLLCGAPV